MDNNIKYWETRYKNMSGIQTVGGRGINIEKYNRTNKAFLDIIQSLLEGKTITNCLDFGCGIGRWQPYLTTISKFYYGCDIIKNVIEECKIKYDPSISSFDVITNNKIPFNNIKFDLIWTCVVLQHVVNEDLLKSYVSQFKDRLNTGGIIFITENIYKASNNNYLCFRGREEYELLFKEFNLKMVKTYDFDTKEPHGIFIGLK